MHFRFIKVRPIFALFTLASSPLLHCLLLVHCYVFGMSLHRQSVCVFILACTTHLLYHPLQSAGMCIMSAEIDVHPCLCTITALSTNRLEGRNYGSPDTHLRLLLHKDVKKGVMGDHRLQGHTFQISTMCCADLCVRHVD